MYQVSIIQRSRVTNLIRRIRILDLELKPITSENAAYCTSRGFNNTRLSKIGSSKISPNYLRHSLNKISFYATFTGQTEVDFNVYDRVCEETLESLTEYFEELLDGSNVLESADVTYSSGVLTINLGNKFGTYVINRQAPNRQIWLSSPLSGPKRYDLVAGEDLEGEQYWVYKHDGQTLHQLLQNEISKILDVKVDFSKCSYSKL